MATLDVNDVYVRLLQVKKDLKGMLDTEEFDMFLSARSPAYFFFVRAISEVYKIVDELEK